MKSIHEYIREFARVIAADKLELHALKISFEAPPKDVVETLDIKNQKQFEANFQWRRYSLLVATPDKTQWYVYIFNLDPWGTKQSETAEVIASDPQGGLLKGNPIDVVPKDLDAMFPNLVKGPNLDPDLPESMVTYINGHKKDLKKKYSPSEFIANFENSKTEDGTNFYILISKTNELKTPFGKTVGKAPEKK